jgi:GNAT superfamily N-acetyltransferase
VLQFKKIDKATKEFSIMLEQFGLEYSKVDNGAVKSLPVGFDLADNHYEVYKDFECIGFIQIVETAGVIRANCIELVYVKPEFRGRGLAVEMYQQAIKHYGCKMISLTYHRVDTLPLINMWRKCGFIGIILTPGQSGADRAICMLTTVKLSTPLYFNLDKKGVTRCREHSQKICDKLSNRYGLILHRKDVKHASHELLAEVIENHFGKRIQQMDRPETNSQMPMPRHNPLTELFA